MLAAWILRRCVALALKSMNCTLSNVNDHVMPTMIYFVAAVEKEEVELICGVCWVCMCERDWASPCPFGEPFGAGRQRAGWEVLWTES